MKKLILSALVATLGFACSRNSSTNDPVENVRQATKEEALQANTFKSECQQKPINQIVTGLMTGFGASMKSQRVQFRFEGANVHRQTWMYSTGDCSGQEAFVFDEGGQMAIHEDQKTADGATAVDFEYRKVEVRVISATGVEIANAVKLCGAEDWSADALRDVTTKSEEWNCYSTRVPRQEFNVYRLDNGDKTLILGTDLKDNSPEKRPGAVDGGIRYTAE